MKTRVMLFASLSLCALAPQVLAAPAKLAEVFNGDMLGTNLRYFESKAGIARTSNGDSHSYKVQGCDITANAAGGTISELRLELSPTCKADLHSFIGDFAPKAGQPLTFGALDQSTGGGGIEFYADCLQLCGNAYDPSVYGLWEGPRAIGFMQVLVEAKLVDDAPIKAASDWAQAMTQAKGDDFVTDTRFNCERTFDAQALQAFAKVQATAVTLGTELTKPGC